MDKRDLKNDELVIAGRIFNSRLLVGTGKYNDFAGEANCASAASLGAPHHVH